MPVVSDIGMSVYDCKAGGFRKFVSILICNLEKQNIMKLLGLFGSCYLLFYELKFSFRKVLIPFILMYTLFYVRSPLVIIHRS